MDILEKASLYHLYELTGFSSKKLKEIKYFFGTFFNAWQAKSEDWLTIIPEQTRVEAIIRAKKRINLLETAERFGGALYKMVTLDDIHYPRLLKQIYRAPYLLFYIGNLDLLQSLCIAMVGSRRATAYGRKTARELARKLSEAELTVVSGMARGVDSEAHLGALGGIGSTVAVLGSGIDVVYPRENRNLYQSICERGLVMSEFYPGTPPEAGNFPRRNRIISGLSKGVVVVEAKMKSGALITADYALEQGRDVFSVPGPITSEYSAGTNHLIKQGAKLVTCCEDILEEYFQNSDKGHIDLEQPSLHILDRNEQEILQYISYDPIHMDDIVISTGIEIGLVSTLLLSLELAGLIISLPGNYYTRI